MPKISDEKCNEKKILPIVFMIDTSGSMSGDRIASIKSALESILFELSNVNSNNFDFEIRCGILTFSTGAKWITPNRLETPEEIDIDRIIPGGVTYFGDAFATLDEKFNNNVFLTQGVGYICPMIVFFTDGYSIGDWWRIKEDIYEKNEWIRNANKIILSIDEADAEELYEIVLKNRHIVHIYNDSLVEDFFVTLNREIIKEYKNFYFNPEHINCTDIINRTIDNLGVAVKIESQWIHKYSIELEWFFIY